MYQRTLLLAVLFAVGSGPQLVDAQARPMTPHVTGTVVIAPTPVSSSGGVALAYEVHLANRSRFEVTLTRVEVLREDGSVLHVEEDSLLYRNLGRAPTGGPLQGSARAVLAPGSWAVVYMWVTVEDSAAVPRLIRHRIAMDFQSPQGTVREGVLEVGSTSPGPPAIVLGPPLGEGLWRTSNNSNNSGHRRGIFTAGNMPQRFAIDYAQVDEFGRNRTSNLFRNESHFAFGSPVLAVADGVVLSAADSMSENSVGRQPPRSFPATMGNYVDLEIGPGVYASYLHLQSGSVRVQAGDTVRLGQVIGRLGNTGASIAPHLHFELTRASSAQGRTERGDLGEGLPFTFPSYELVGQDQSPYCSCDGSECATRPLDIREFEMPSEGQVVRFAGGGPGEGIDSRPVGLHLEALCYVAEGQLLRDERRILEAVAAYERALELSPGLRVPALQFGALCWRGSIWGFADTVLDMCDSAVTAEPDHPDLRRRRALALALSGNIEAAIADFDAYLTWLSDEPPLATWEASFDGLAARSIDTLRTQVMGWRDALQEGRNPFTSDVLEELRTRTRPPQ